MLKAITYLLRILLLLTSIGLFIYLLLPNPPFPKQLPDSVQSLENADTEDPLRRAYFTNFSREEIVNYYKNQFAVQGLGHRFLLRLNYPPEDAQTLIRDQTRSSFLEEIVQPLRVSFFINGFEPSVAKDDIRYKGVHYERKITVKYVKSSPIVRVPIFLSALVLFGFVAQDCLASLFKIFSKLND